MNEVSLVENRIFTIRGVPVMLDSDISDLYGVEVRRLNEQVKRNIDRFPVSYSFQLTEEEWSILKSQIATSSYGHGGKRRLPRVFSEHGVVMLSAVLKSKSAIDICHHIIDVFIKWRKTFKMDERLADRINKIEWKQYESEQKFEAIFNALEKSENIPKQGIFFDGQIFDAYNFVSDIIRKAMQSITLVDNYIDDSILSLLSKRRNQVKVIIYTHKFSEVNQLDIKKWSHQYGTIEVHVLKNNHDRFIIIDEKELYHIGASLKDLGKKIFAFSRMDKELVHLLKRLQG